MDPFQQGDLGTRLRLRVAEEDARLRAGRPPETQHHRWNRPNTLELVIGLVLAGLVVLGVLALLLA